MQLTQQIRISPTKEQKEVLRKLSEKCRLLYNFALKERIEAFENDSDFIGYKKQQNGLPKLKEKYPEYNWVYSKVLQYTLKTLDADYKSFFALRKKGDKKARPPKYKGKKYFTTMVYNQSGFKIERGFIDFSHKYNNIPLRFKIPEKFVFEKVYQISIYQKDNEFFVSIIYEKEAKQYKDNKKYQAIDIGIKNIVTAVNTKGKFIQIKNQRPDKYWQKKIQKIQSRRDHCKKRSREWVMLNKNLKRMKRKCANQIKDFQHKLSRKVVDNTKANTIVVGKLSAKEMGGKKKQNHRGTKGLNRAIQNTGTIGRFVRFLTYKATLMGKIIIEISEKNTSKMCCVCGKKYEIDLSVRTMKCSCGNELDRDKNSAINIMNRFLSQNAKWTGYSQFVSNLRQTGIPIGMHSQEAP